MLRLFPLRRSFSLDLAPDDSNSNFLLHANDDYDHNGHSTHVGAHLLSSQLPVGTSKSSLPNSSVLYPNMSTAVHWPVDDIDDALAADFDGSLSGLGIELGTASFNMSEALMALPNLSSLKHQAESGNHHSIHHSTGHLNSNLLLASSLQANLSAVRHNELATSIERTDVPSPHVIASGSGAAVDDKPVAVVHGKKNRLAFGSEDESNSIKRFCLSSDREAISNVHTILLANGVLPNNDANQENHHQCNDECFSANDSHCHLRHSSSVPDLRSNFAAAAGSFAGNSQEASNSAASSPSSSSTSTPSTSFFSQIISSQVNNISSNNSHTSSTLNHELVHSTASRHTSKFQYVLGASTSMAIKMHEETMTYLNQGQSYEIKLKKVGDLSEMKGKTLKTIMKVCFHDRRLQYMEKELIDQWKEQRPLERILEVDIPLSYGIHDVRHDARLVNRTEFFWDPTKETGVFIRINCISTEFTPKKHGGEKGVPFRIVIETHCKDSNDPNNCLHAASCQVKVFKPKGADRKHKTDREKMNKKPSAEQEKFQPSYDCTVFTDYLIDNFNVYGLPPGLSGAEQEMKTVEVPKVAQKKTKQTKTASVSTSSAASSPQSEKNATIKPYTFSLFSDINENSFDLNFSNFSMSNFNTGVLSTTASSDFTQKWLKENRFEAYVSTFANFSGSDILLLSKEDLIQICGLTDGIRLHNALHSRSVKSKLSIYICPPNEDVFRAIYMDSLTVSELQSKIISNLLKSKCTYLKRLCIVGPSGVKILMTDEVVRNLPDESLYMVECAKDLNGEYHAVMKSYTK